MMKVLVFLFALSAVASASTDLKLKDMCFEDELTCLRVSSQLNRSGTETLSVQAVCKEGSRNTCPYTVSQEVVFKKPLVFNLNGIIFRGSNVKKRCLNTKNLLSLFSTSDVTLSASGDCKWDLMYDEFGEQSLRGVKVEINL